MFHTCIHDYKPFLPPTHSQVKANQRDTEWDTYTCVLGFPVMGIWPPGSDGTDVSLMSLSASQINEYK